MFFAKLLEVVVIQYLSGEQQINMRVINTPSQLTLLVERTPNVVWLT